MRGPKRPLYLMVALASCLVMATYNYFENRSVFYDEIGSEDILHREKEILVSLRIAQLLGERGRVDEIKERLEQARINRDIDYYIATQKGRTVFWGTADGTFESLLADYKPGVDYITKDVSFRAEMVNRDLLVMVGINKQSDVAFALYMKHYRRQFIEESLIFGLLGLAVFFYYSRDLLLLVASFRSKDRKSFRLIKTKSRESEILAQGLMGYEASVELLQNKSERLERQVLPSLKKEILSGRVPPYDFDCTLVRTDINNFSTIYNAHDVTTFMSVINSFFVEVTEIVARHRGLVHEFVGDEVIFYIKDDDTQNSFMAATAVIFEINHIAQRYSANTMQAYGYPFTVKSSLAHGTIRFGPLVNGHSIAGAVLIETVRILSHVVEKDGNVICFDSAHLSRLSGLVKARETMSVQLKGFNGLRRLVVAESRDSIEMVLNRLTLNSVENLTYYRSDSDLIKIIKYLQSQMKDSSNLHELAFKSRFDLVNGVLKLLREFPVATSTQNLSDASGIQSELAALIETCHGKLRETHFKQASVLISNILMLTQNLIPHSRLENDLALMLKSFLQDSDSRVVSSALESLTYFRAPVDSNIYRTLLEKALYNADNRIVANALVQEGMLDLSAMVIRQLRSMVVSTEPGECASALFVIGELARYHRLRDLVYYSTHVEFKRLLLQLPIYAIHSDKKIRKQTWLAAKKAADSEIIDALFKKIDTSGDSTLIAEAHQVFETAYFPLPVASKKSA